MTTKADEIKDILKSEFGLDGGNLTLETPLFSSSLLDSLNSLKLLMALEARYGLSISPLDVSLDDLDTIESIAQTVDRLQS